MRGAQSRRSTAIIGSVFEGDIYVKKVIRSIDNSCRNNTDANLKLWIESLMLFDGEINNSATHTKCLCVLWLVLLTPVSIVAQGSGVTLTGAVNETVALSIAPNSIHSDVDVDVVSSGNSVRMTLSGTSIKSAAIRVGLLVRSNIGFNISGILESKTVLLTQLSIIDVRATGRLVLPEVIDKLEISQGFDMRGRKDQDSSENDSAILDVSQPFALLSGPRVSLGGTLESPNNALQITVLIRIKPQLTRDWRVNLTFLTK